MKAIIETDEEDLQGEKKTGSCMIIIAEFTGIDG